MEPNARREAALRLLAETKLKRSNYEPPLQRVLWRLGFDAPPPHFASFGGNTLVYGAFFGSVWGFFMWLFLWRSQGAPISAAVLIAFIAGLLFGVAMASYYALGRRKYKLPSWHSLSFSHTGA